MIGESVLKNAKQAQVNEYLFYAQKLLQVESKHAASLDSLEMNAVHASVYLCLKKSWESWLQELAVYMNVTIESFSSFSQVTIQELPESQCLLAFKQDADSWLNKLLERIDDNFKAIQPIDIKASRLKSNASLLDVVLIDGDANKVTRSATKTIASKEPLAETDILVWVMKEFKQYMQSVRSRQAEW